MTVSDALATGPLLAILADQSDPNAAGCSVANYDPRITCSGWVNGIEYNCWDPNTQGYPYSRMWEYLDSVTPVAGHFFQRQALWQESPESVVDGGLRNSSLVLDESRSGLNGAVAGALREGRWEEVGLLEVNNVCDGGVKLLEELRERGR